MTSLGPLKLPFIGASAAIYALTYLWRTDLGFDATRAFFQTLIVGSLAVVVLYALMRTLRGTAV